MNISPGIEIGCCYIPFDCQRKYSTLTSNRHLPAEPKEALNYLAKFVEKIESPYTEANTRVFIDSYRADVVTRRWLQIGLFATTLLTLTAVLPIIGSDYNLTKLSKSAVIVVLVAALANNILSFISTGTNPHYASCIANECQDATLEVMDFYREDLPNTLLSMNREEAQEIAQNLQRSKNNILLALSEYHPKLTAYEKSKMVRGFYKIVDQIALPLAISVDELPV